MKRSELAHIIRSAATLSGERDIVVFGSQAILGAMDEARLPLRATLSPEADLVLGGSPGGDAVEAAIGLDSRFHRTHEIYADVVDIDTAKLPRGWRRRLIPFETPETQPGRGLCLDRHDLVVSKLVAHRDKDLEFVNALHDEGALSLATLEKRLQFVDGATQTQLDSARAWVASRKGESKQSR